MPAKYTIVVNRSGFGNQTKTAELLVNQPATIDFALTVQASTVTVDVSASAQTLNTSDASLGNSADNALIQALPSETRNVPDLLSLQPGVLYLPNRPMTAAAAPSTEAVPIRATSPSTVSTTTTRSTDMRLPAFFARPRIPSRSSASPPAIPMPMRAALLARRSAWSPSREPTNIHGAAYEYNRPPLRPPTTGSTSRRKINEGLAQHSHQGYPQHLRRYGSVVRS